MKSVTITTMFIMLVLFQVYGRVLAISEILTPIQTQGPCDIDTRGCIHGWDSDDKLNCHVYYHCTHGSLGSPITCNVGTHGCTQEPCYFDYHYTRCLRLTDANFGSCSHRCGRDRSLEPCIPISGVCVNSYKYPDKHNCSVYYQCTGGTLGSEVICSSGTDGCQSASVCVFDVVSQKCVSPTNALLNKCTSFERCMNISSGPAPIVSSSTPSTTTSTSTSTILSTLSTPTIYKTTTRSTSKITHVSTSIRASTTTSTGISTTSSTRASTTAGTRSSTTLSTRASTTPMPRVMFKSYFPTYGLVDGGTTVTLMGVFENVNTMELGLVPVKQGVTASTSAIISSWNETHIVMVTTKVPGYYAGTQYHIYANYTDNQGSEYQVSTDMPFMYKANPVLHDIYPTKSFLSGGIKITAMGTNLDSVISPVMTVTVEQRLYPSDPDVFIVKQTMTYMSDKTTVLNSTSIIGVTPEIPAAVLSDRQIRDVSGSKQKTVTFLGFQFDGYTKYHNLSQTLGDKGELRLVADPSVVRFDNDVLVYDSNKQTFIEIKGEKFTQGATLSDYVVSIGEGRCIVQPPLLDNVVKCDPPDQEPAVQLTRGVGYRPGQPLVTMAVGNTQFSLGYVDYVEEPSLILYIAPSTVLVGLVVISALIIIYCVCFRNPSNAGHDICCKKIIRTICLQCKTSANNNSQFLCAIHPSTDGTESSRPEPLGEVENERPTTATLVESARPIMDSVAASNGYEDLGNRRSIEHDYESYI